ncbi:MAG: hypothetical protein WKG00_33645 [Polyangiaceae bacterium]
MTRAPALVPTVIVAPPVAPLDTARGLEAASEALKARVLEAARADIALIKGLIDRIKRAFFEIGVALGRLKDPARIAVLGYRSFHEMCVGELGMSGSKADDLVAIAANMTAEEARGMGQMGALSLVTLCKATPENDRPADIVDAKIPLPSGGVLDVGKASARERIEAAKEIRRASDAAGTRGGRSVTAKERSTAADLQQRMRAAGLERASVEAKATRSGQQADLAITGVPIGAVSTLCAAIGGRGTTRRVARSVGGHARWSRGQGRRPRRVARAPGLA